MCIRTDFERNIFLAYFSLNWEINPIVLTNESNPEDNEYEGNLPLGKILTLFLLKIMKFSTSKRFFSYEISKLNTHETKVELKFIITLLFIISSINLCKFYDSEGAIEFFACVHCNII